MPFPQRACRRPRPCLFRRPFRLSSTHHEEPTPDHRLKKPLERPSATVHATSYPPVHRTPFILEVMGNACCATSRPGDSSDVRKKQLLFAKSNQETKRIEAQYAGSDRTLSEDRASKGPLEGSVKEEVREGVPSQATLKSNAFYAAQSDTEESAGEGAPVSLHVLGGQAAGML